MPSVYRAPVVKDLQQWFAHYLHPTVSQSVLGYLSLLSDHLLRGLLHRQPAVYAILNNYHPDYLCVDVAELIGINWKLPAAQQAIASEHGFADWQAVQEAGAVFFDPDWENALQALLTGEYQILRELLIRRPQLTTMHSHFGHQATLLHYVAANGVEFRHQQVPENIVDLTSLLLDHGADPHAKMEVYAGAYEVAALIASSAHPKAAGVENALLELFEDL